MPNESPAEGAPAPSGLRVLVLPLTRADGLAIGKLFAANHIDTLVCDTVTHLCDELHVGVGALILPEESLREVPQELYRCLREQEVWSDLPIIMLSRSGREPAALSEIVARLGNVSVVERPIRTSTLITLVRSSLRARQRQYEVRAYLEQQEQVQAERHRIASEREQLLDSERAARGEAERAGRTKDEFLATLSHELRTPLNAVLGWTQVMRRLQNLPSEAVNALAVIERNARAQAKIIADLLDMSSIISGKVRLDLQRVDLEAVVAATVESVRPTAQAKGVELVVTLRSDGAAVRGDPNRLQQVLWNLLTNALKFTRAEGHVAVTLARAGQNVDVAVADDGDGIDPAFLPHVFDRFRQADASTARQHGGLGLGLSIVKQLVEMHGGSIEARSAGPGHGATFHFTLPVMAPAEDLVAPAAAHDLAEDSGRFSLAAKPDADLTGLTVLVVDDEPDARALIERLLRDCHASVLTAASADEALRAVARDMPDVIVSDIGMPGEDGYSFIRRVRALQNGKSAIPAIALTAYARMEDRMKAIDAGFQLHLAKPVEPVELVSMVHSLARRGATN